MTQLEVTNLVAGYGGVKVLDYVNLTLNKGEYVSIIGPNGAGKSTLMKSIFGLTDYMGGEIILNGEDISGMEPNEILRKNVVYVPQDDNIFPPLSVEENLKMGGYILDHVSEEAFEQVFEYFPVLKDIREQPAGTLSGGQQQMVAIGRGLMLNPDILLLDEPSSGLAPDLVTEMFNKIDEINQNGTSILLVEQNAIEALQRCERGYVLVHGENRFDGEGDKLLQDEKVQQEFLGG